MLTVKSKHFYLFPVFKKHNSFIYYIKLDQAIINYYTQKEDYENFSHFYLSI